MPPKRPSPPPERPPNPGDSSDWAFMRRMLEPSDTVYHEEWNRKGFYLIIESYDVIITFCFDLEGRFQGLNV